MLLIPANDAIMPLQLLTRDSRASLVIRVLLGELHDVNNKTTMYK